MTNTELRIGNYVKAQEKYRKVKSMYVDGSVGLDNGFTYSMDLVSPIPLTTEILAKCGGRSYGGWYGLRWETRIWDESNEFVYQLMDGILDLFCNDTRVLSNKNPTLHWLMNNYHSLTGTELNIEL